MDYENPWTYNGQVVTSEILEEYIGFVYLITNTENNRKYIGKKLFKRTKRKSVKGKKKKVLVESDWKKYYGSNENLLDDLKSIGYNKFNRVILRLCKTKGECNYYEAKYQFENAVLESDNWYNSWIMLKVHKKHLPS